MHSRLCILANSIHTNSGHSLIGRAVSVGIICKEMVIHGVECVSPLLQHATCATYRKSNAQTSLGSVEMLDKRMWKPKHTNVKVCSEGRVKRKGRRDSPQKR